MINAEERDLPLLRKLPIRTLPVEGESFASYLDRLAHDMRVSLYDLLTAVGIASGKDRGRNTKIPGGYGVFLTPERMTRLCYVTDLPEPVVKGMLLTRYDSVCADFSGIDVSDARAVSRPANRSWVYLSGTHACPACLAEGRNVETQPEPVAGVWQVSWRLPWVFSCTEHGNLLLSCCPVCDNRLRTGWYANRNKPIYSGRIPKPMLCANILPPEKRVRGQDSACSYPLKEADTPSLIAWPDVLETQEYLQRLLDDSAGTPTVAGESVPTLEYFGTLRALASLLLAYSTADDLGNAPAFALNLFERRRGAYLEGRKNKLAYSFSMPPEDATMLCAVVPAAVQLAGVESTDALAHAIQPLVHRARADGLRTPAVLRLLTGSSACLAEAFQRIYTGGMSSTTALLRQSENPIHASGRQGEFSPDYVPQLLWEDTYLELFADLFPHKSRYYARRVCSMSIVRLMNTPSWSKAAELLELPAERSRQIASEVLGVLRRSSSDKFETFAERIENVAYRLNNTPEDERVDYRQRRKALEHLDVVPYAEWERICGRVGIGPGKDGVRNRCAAAWIWCRVAGGDRWLSPAIRESASNTIRVHYQRFEQECSGELERLLTEYGHALLRESGTR